MVRAPRVAVRFGLPLLAGVIVYALALASIALSRESATQATIWFSNGAGLGLLLRQPRRRWGPLVAAIVVGALGAGLTAGQPFPLASALVACNLVEILLVATLFHRRFGSPAHITRFDQLGFLGLLAIGGALISAPLGAWSLYMLGVGFDPAMLGHWMIASALGIAIVTPLFITLGKPEASGAQANPFEYLLILGLAALTAYLIFTSPVSSIFLLTPMLVLGGLRLRIDQAAILVILTTAIALVATIQGSGPLAALDPFLRILILQAFMATAVMLTVPIAALRAERARTAAALKVSEEHYRLLADHSSDLVLRLSGAGRADYVSSAATRLLGLSSRLLHGKAFVGRIHLEDRARFAAAIDRARRTGEAVTCFRMRHARGHDRWVEAHMRLAGPALSLLPGQEPRSCHAAAEGRCRPGAEAPCAALSGTAAAECVDGDWPVVASLRDIHDRRSAELLAADSAVRLRESHRLLMMAEELASLGHWVVDPVRRELVLSIEAANMLALPQLTLEIGEALALLRPSDRMHLLRTLAAARRAQAPFECTVRMGNPHSERTLQLRMQLQGDGPGSSLFGVVSDITAKLDAEQRLIAALDEARAAAAFRSQFLATMSHEIRTPMTGVIGMIELLEADPDPAERRLYLQTLRQSGDLLMAVLNDILDFSKVDSGRVTIADEPFDVGEMLLTTTRLFDRSASSRGLRLRLEAPPPDALWLRGDAVRLRQVISNLLSNAIKFSDRGEVVLRCAADPAPGGRHRLRLSVVDHGVGIGPELRARLFEPFVQGDEGGASGGTGLGLAISRRLVAAMGGTISLRSRTGHGSTFVIDLVLRDAAPLAVQQTERTQTSARSLAILLAEDNPVNQLLVTALCKRLGHQVTCAADGEAAVSASLDRHYDLILMDMQMPRCDGLTAARRIRAGAGPNATTPIIALTADAASERRPLYTDAGLNGLLTKPIDSNAFSAVLTDLAALADLRDVASDETIAPARSAAPLDPDTLEEMRGMLGSVRLARLLDLLATELLERPRALRAAIADRDFHAASAEAHSLKGAAANLGANAVSEAARRCEEAIAQAATGDSRLLAAALRRLGIEVGAAQQALTDLRERPTVHSIGA